MKKKYDDNYYIVRKGVWTPHFKIIPHITKIPSFLKIPHPSPYL